MTEFFVSLAAFTLFTAWLCTHPLKLCLLLVSFSGLVSAITGMLVNKWFMYALILIFLGGMMIIFIYVTTLSNNEKMTKITLSPLLTAVITASLVIMLMSQPVTPPTSSIKLMTHLYTPASSSLLMFLMALLLLVLFVVVKLSESFKGALVKFL